LEKRKKDETMGLFDWFRKDKKKAVAEVPVAVERNETGRWVEVKVVPATVTDKADSIPKIEVVKSSAEKPVAKKAPAKKPVAKTTEKKEAIKKDLADAPVAKAKPKPKTTPKKK
jgi:hypothetical protein